MQQHDGLWWPDSDRVAYKIISEELPFLDEAIDVCKDWKLAIQAGGNAGIYPLRLAEVFETVITIEADYQNYECLVLNTANSHNLFPIYGALGARRQQVGVSRYPENSGASYIKPGDDIAMFTIDAMGVDCDLIQLDIEGMEGEALKGAEETITRCRPVIMIEDLHGERYGYKKGACADYLTGLGYDLISATRTDSIWRPRIQS